MDRDLQVDVQQQEQPSLGLRDLLTLLFKHKIKMVTTSAAVFTAVAAFTFLLPPVYEAQSTLLVKFGREYTYRPEVSEKGPVMSFNQEEALNSEINIMASEDVIEKVVRTLGVTRLYPDLAREGSGTISPFDTAVLRFRKALNVDVAKKTQVLQVRFQHNDRQLAARAVNLLVENYKEKHFQVYNGPESEFLEKQLAAYRGRLQASEQSLQEFKQKNQVYSLDEERALMLKQRTDLDAALKASQARIEGMQERLLTLNSQLKLFTQAKDRYTQTERDRIIVDAKAQLLALQLKERSLLDRYPESNLLIVNIRKDIDVVSRFLQVQEEDIRGKVSTSNTVYLEAEKELMVTEADLNAELAKTVVLQRQLTQSDQAVRSLDRNEKPLQNLLRDVATNDKNYRIYLDRLEEARISGDMNRQKLANLSVIQAATTPSKPVKPKKLLNLIVGSILAALSGLGSAMLAGYLSQTICTPEDVQRRLHLPVLTTVEVKTGSS